MEASPQLNLYDGHPHAVTLYLYPLSGPGGFEQMSVDDLLEGAVPPGTQGAAVPITVGPGETREFQETFPRDTAYLGVVVDYYRAYGDREGVRKLSVEAKCGWGSPSIALSPRDVLLQ